MTPFEMDLGWNPRSPIDMISSADGSVEDVSRFKKRQMDAFESAELSKRLARARYVSYNSQSRQSVQYNVGDQVWLNKEVFKDAVSAHQRSQKL